MAVFLEGVTLEGRLFAAGESEGEGVDPKRVWQCETGGKAILAALARAAADLLNTGAPVAERGNQDRTNAGPIHRFIADNCELIPPGLVA